MSEYCGMRAWLPESPPPCSPSVLQGCWTWPAPLPAARPPSGASSRRSASPPGGQTRRAGRSPSSAGRAVDPRPSRGQTLVKRWSNAGQAAAGGDGPRSACCRSRSNERECVARPIGQLPGLAGIPIRRRRIAVLTYQLYSSIFPSAVYNTSIWKKWHL